MVMMVVMMMVALANTALVAAIIRLRDEQLHDRATDDASAENEWDRLGERVDVVRAVEVVVGDGEFDGCDEGGEDGDVEEAAEEMHVEDM